MSIETGQEWNEPIIEITKHQPQEWHTFEIPENNEYNFKPLPMGIFSRRLTTFESFEPFNSIPMSEDELIRDYEPINDENHTIEIKISGYQAPIKPEINVHIDDIIIENISDFEDSDRE